MNDPEMVEIATSGGAGSVRLMVTLLKERDNFEEQAAEWQQIANEESNRADSALKLLVRMHYELKAFLKGFGA